MTQPTSASRNDLPAALQRLDRQLPASNIQLYLHDSTYASYPHRTSSCAQLWLDHTSYWHHPSSWRPNTTATDFTHTFVIPAIKSSLLLYLLSCLCSFHCLWLSLLVRFKLKSIEGSTCLSAPQQFYAKSSLYIYI